MLDLYTFNGSGIGFNGDPMFESELNKCKTQRQRDRLVRHYQTCRIISFAVSFIVALVICGVITFIKWASN